MSCVINNHVEGHKYINQINTCNITWAADIPQNKNIIVRYFCGESTDYHPDLHESVKYRCVHLPGVQDDMMSASDKQWLGLKFCYINFKSKFYLVVGTDNYINLERTSLILSKYNYNVPLVIGGIHQERYINSKSLFAQKITFPLGGSGIFISRAALKILEPKLHTFKTDFINICHNGQNYTLDTACDVAMSYFCQKYQIPIIIEHTLFPVSFEYYYNRDNQSIKKYIESPDSDLENFDPVKNGVAICHYITPQNMIKLHLLRNADFQYLVLSEYINKFVMNNLLDFKKIHFMLKGNNSVFLHADSYLYLFLIIKLFIDELVLDGAKKILFLRSSFFHGHIVHNKKILTLMTQLEHLIEFRTVEKDVQAINDPEIIGIPKLIEKKVVGSSCNTDLIKRYKLILLEENNLLDSYFFY